MSMKTAKRSRLLLYKVTHPGNFMTAGGVQVEVRYYTRAYVPIGEFLFRHHFMVSAILPDIVLRLPWLRSCNPTIDWKERYTDVQHGSTSYRLSFHESRDSTQLHFRAASKLDLLLTISSSASKVSSAGSPAPPAKECTDLRSSTGATNDAETLDESETEDGITNKECSDMEIGYIWLPKGKSEICRADLRGDQVFLCCMPRSAVPVDQMHSMQDQSDNDGLDSV